METRILEIDAGALNAHLDRLAQLLIDCVAAGAAISFMAPLSHAEARRFWSQDVRAEVAAGRRVLFAAWRGDELLGSVQLITSMPPNQPHRCEIAKMMVDPKARRRGVGRLLMNRALDGAREMGKTLVTLDTRTGDVAEPLYASVGFEIAGVIPDFAWDPDRKAKHATTIMFRRI